MIHHFLETPQLSYIVGFLQADGHHQSNTRNRGKITIELKSSDRHLLEEFQALFPTYSSISERTRDTNFKNNYTSCIWSLFDLETRIELIKLGVPVGSKSEIVAPPSWSFVTRDYFRGLIDGDGSLGITSIGIPFISLTTKSDAIARGFIEYIKSVTGKEKKASRNERDLIYNIMVTKEGAQILAHTLYAGSILRLDRKFADYEGLMKWSRPDHMMKKKPGKLWGLEQDEYVRTHTVKEAMTHLDRSERSIRMRRYRIGKL